MRFLLRRRGGALLLLIGVVAAVALVSQAPARRPGVPERHPQTSWVACNRNAHTRRPSTFRPLSDAAAAALVTHEPETRPLNARPYTIGGRRYPAANDYVPTNAQLRRFRSSHISTGQPVLRFNPYFRYVDGRDGLSHPSTDDLIQWSAHKWGIPEDWLRAEYVQESYWDQFWLGDEGPTSRSWYALYPRQARVAHTLEVYRSMGITQVQWTPSGSVGPGSNPLRWESTAFNLDYQAAMVRFYYDNPDGARSEWGDSTYVPCQPWKSIGGWFRPYPWNNADQAGYIAKVQHNLADRAWSSGSFVSWSPPSIPPGITFR
ncbi:MAG TPA: hypothetical protein VMF07_17710 [Solirubrobacteraceae bacterium]|nr:hypothetical protein [Solirubrobacteraceae bacterium]